ncbi:hypothetical protein BV25DRAFT_1921897 [Artomyces pyxidatus]|uniref:Uncharacterized protein n=1 Tax=Artomyces pyxidatus TaxID=48021 RepID=A0ACB8SFU0_9AGAM|nr:hypothetical protein BV25DRAFT_1921897 [Artomyces pyxidatus]
MASMIEDVRWVLEAMQYFINYHDHYGSESSQWATTVRNWAITPLGTREQIDNLIAHVFTDPTAVEHAKSEISTIQLIPQGRCTEMEQYLLQRWTGIKKEDRATHRSATARNIARFSQDEWDPLSHAGSTRTARHEDDRVIERITESSRGRSAGTMTRSTRNQPTSQNHGPPPQSDSPLEEWRDFFITHPDQMPTGIEMDGHHCPTIPSIETYLYLRNNGPDGSSTEAKKSRYRWMSVATGLFSIPNLYYWLPQHYEGGTHNLTIESVAMHYANRGYNPAQIIVLENYARARRNAQRDCPPNDETDWESYPTRREVEEQYGELSINFIEAMAAVSPRVDTH